MTSNDKDKKLVKKRIMEEKDYIYCPRLGNSVEKLVEKNPDGINDDRIQKVLLLTRQELNKWYSSAIQKLREKLNEEGEGE